MAGVIPNNYVNTEMVDNYCFDSCEFQYNYQPIDIPSSIANNNYVFQIPILNPNNYKCKFSGEKYKLNNIYIILNKDEIQHKYERYETDLIIGEMIMSHKNENNSQILNICIAIRNASYETELTNILLKKSYKINLNDFIPSKPYNYYYSDTTGNNGGDPNTHWIVFDFNQYMMLVDITSIKSEGSNNIVLPKAPTTIGSIQHHEKGPQFIDKSKQLNCTRLSTNLAKFNSEEDKTMFKNGMFGQKNPIVISLLLFAIFSGIVLLIMGSIYFFKPFFEFIKSKVSEIKKQLSERKKQ